MIIEIQNKKSLTNIHVTNVKDYDINKKNIVSYIINHYKFIYIIKKASLR